jgi:hypothetical protein
MEKREIDQKNTIAQKLYVEHTHTCSRITMNKHMIAVALNVALIAFIVAAAIVGGATIVAIYSFHQTNTVPTTYNMAVYESDGTTLITNGSLVGSATLEWTWTGSQFDLVIVIKNTGNVAYTTSIPTPSAPFPSTWNFTASGTGILAAGATQTVNIAVTPPSPTPGATTGDYGIFIDASA